MQVSEQALYRLRQFWRGFRAEVTDDEVEKAAGILTPAAFALFCRLPVDGRRHSLNVLQTLQKAGDTPVELAAAALLHDVGKVAASAAGLEINLWWRGPLVLLETFAPALLTRLGSADPQRRWRYLLYVHQCHPQIGATWAAAADCSALTCWLIAHHQDPVAGVGHATQERLLARLQWADRLN